MFQLFNKIRSFLLIISLMLISVVALADPPDEETCEEMFTVDPVAYQELCGEEVDPCPLDTNVLYLIAIGSVMALIFIRKSGIKPAVL